MNALTTTYMNRISESKETKDREQKRPNTHKNSTKAHDNPDNPQLKQTEAK